jgi:hypothetical protein
MRSRSFWIIALSVLFFISCNREEDPVIVISEEPVFADLAFLRPYNPGLTENVWLEEEEGLWSGVLPEGARIGELVASFDCADAYQVYVDGVEQRSGVTVNDFRKGLHYQVIGPEDTLEYDVDLSYESNIPLPVIYLETENGAVIDSKEDYIPATLRLEGQGQFPDLQSPIQIRGRGNSTWGIHPKKPYQIKFPEKKELLGMPEDKRWLFLAEYSDKTFLRNKFAFEMAYRSDLEWTPHSEFAEVYLNGSYNGLYHITQKVEESTNRLDITDEGFLLEIDHPDRLDPDDIFFYSDYFLLNIKEPDLEDYGSESDYIESYIDAFEDALFGPYFKHPTNGYRKFIDEKSVVDWFIVNEIAKNVDAKSFSSIFMYLAPGQKMKMGPIWDFDLGYGNVNYADPEFPQGWWVRENPWIDRMLQDPAFVALVKERYAHLRSKQNELFDLMDEEVLYLRTAIEANDDRWHTLGMYVWPNPVWYNTYDEELAHLKKWITQRLAWMDAAIQNL